MKKGFNFYLIVTLLLMGLFGCTLKIDNDIDIEVPVYEYDDGFNYINRKNINPEDVPSSLRDLELEKNGDYEVSYETVTATSLYDECCTMGVNNDILFPGALVDTSNNSYRPITIKRAPITISANLETILGSDASISTTIKIPSLSNVRNGIREILNKNITISTNLPSNLSYEVREITNETEFKMNLGFGLQVSKFSLSEDFSYGNLNKQTNLVVVLKQVYYTVDMDAPNEYNSRDLFNDSLSSKEINKALEGTIPAYVSSVAYGRIAMISIQTNYSKGEIENALSAAWGKQSDNPGLSSNKKLSVNFDSALNNMSTDVDTTIKCYVYGGSSGQNIPIGTNSSETLSKLFESFNGAGDSALPISYTMRHLNGELAKIQSCNEYTIKHVKYNPKKLMNWSYLDDLFQDGSFFKSNSLTLDFSAMIDYSNPSEADINANRVITIPKNIIDLKLVGPNKGTEGVEYNNLSIILDYRDKPITITLDSISFNAEENNGLGACLYSGFDAEVILNIVGRVSLKGKNGVAAIKCNNLKIMGSGSLQLFGGDGYTETKKSISFVGAGIDIKNSFELDIIGSFYSYGGKTTNKDNNGNGSSGYPGIYANSVSLSATSVIEIYGGSGGDGANGADGIKTSKTLPKIGFDGGTGGVSIDCNYLNVKSNNLYLHGGIGGTGGVGGNGYDGITGWGFHTNASNGATGGTGGTGGIALDLNMLIEYNGNVIKTYSGNGGTGGTGGNGGNGGVVNNENTWIVSSSYQYGLAGNGGTGGDGGIGGTEILNNEFIISTNGLGGTGGRGGTGGDKWLIENWKGTADNPNYMAKCGNSGIDGNNGLNG